MLPQLQQTKSLNVEPITVTTAKPSQNTYTPDLGFMMVQVCALP